MNWFLAKTTALKRHDASLCTAADLIITDRQPIRYCRLIFHMARLFAALHDASMTMIERHYEPRITEGLGELATQAIIPTVPGGEAERKAS